MNTPKLITLIAAGFATAHFVQAAPAEQNWGQWRGPRADGVAPNGDPPTEWSESKNVKWKFRFPARRLTLIVGIIWFCSARPSRKTWRR